MHIMNSKHQIIVSKTIMDKTTISKCAVYSAISIMVMEVIHVYTEHIMTAAISSDMTFGSVQCPTKSKI